MLKLVFKNVGIGIISFSLMLGRYYGVDLYNAALKAGTFQPWRCILNRAKVPVLSTDLRGGRR